MPRMAERPIRMGMIGGGSDAFIGGVHRMAARLDDSMCLVAGALSSTPERAQASGQALGLPASRTYDTWQDLLTGESALPEDERIEVVVIVAPNDMHAAAAIAALQAGFHVICDKPLTINCDLAEAIVAAQEATGRVFAVTYNYTGFLLLPCGMIAAGIVAFSRGWDRASKGGRIGVSRGHPSLL